MRTAAASCAVLAWAAVIAPAAPRLANPSFEADAFGEYPGYTEHNGPITGWEHEGNAGVNPWWINAEKRLGPGYAFADNGIIPHGRQAAFIQNIGKLRQSIDGFEEGKKYRVTYYENGRHNGAPERRPRMLVTLGGEVIVSEHELEPVDGLSARTLPYNYVESAVFTAPRDGAFDLVFESTFGDRVAVLIDKVEVVEVE
jgi:hypothetical protein